MRSDMSSSSIGFGTSNSIENYDRQSASPLRTSTPICSPSPEKEIPALNIVDQVEQDHSRYAQYCLFGFKGAHVWLTDNQLWSPLFLTGSQWPALTSVTEDSVLISLLFPVEVHSRASYQLKKPFIRSETETNFNLLQEMEENRCYPDEGFKFLGP